MNYEVDVEEINRFLNSKDNIVGAYCYGMANYNGRMNYHLVLVTNDIEKYRPKFKKINECENTDEVLETIILQGSNCVVFDEKMNGCIFDYTVISVDCFKNSLTEWTNLAIADVFQKPLLTVRTTKELDNYIKQDRYLALLSILSIINKKEVSFFEIMREMFTYKEYEPDFGSDCYDPHFQIGEIYSYIDQNYSQLKAIYCNNPFFTLNDQDKALIDLDTVVSDQQRLPLNMMTYIDSLNRGLFTKQDIYELQGYDYNDDFLNMESTYALGDLSVVSLVRSLRRSHRQKNLVSPYRK